MKSHEESNANYGKLPRLPCTRQVLQTDVTAVTSALTVDNYEVAIVPSDDKRPDGVSAQVVRYGPVPVLDIADQLGPLSAHVLERLAKQTRRHDRRKLPGHHVLDDGEHAAAVAST